MRHVEKILETFFKTVIILAGIIAAVLILYTVLNIAEGIWLLKMLKNSLFLLT